MSYQTQNVRLLAYLKRHRYITRYPAFMKLHIANLWARVAELKQQGHRIDGRRISTQGGARVMQYWLVQGKRKAA